MRFLLVLAVACQTPAREPQPPVAASEGSALMIVTPPPLVVEPPPPVVETSPPPPRFPDFIVEPAIPGDRVVEIAVASVLACARTAHGAVYCWGNDDFDPQNKEICRSSVNNLDYQCHKKPARVRISRATRIAAGSEHVCAILAEGGEVTCWGYNMMDTLGDGSSEMHKRPSMVQNLHDATDLALGGAHTCAIDREHRVWCWGANNMYAVGDGSGIERVVPVRVAIDDAIGLTAGAYHTCAIRKSGTLACWGDNGFMQLGDGTLFARSTPVVVTGIANVVELDADQQNTCARTADGALWCWGVGYVSDPRHELKEDRTGHPRRIAGLADVSAFAVGQSHACAVSGGGVTCWGYDHPMAPVEGLTGVVAIGANWNTTCALHGDGAIDCWGDNSRGQLGDGTLDSRPTPARVHLVL